MGVTICTFFSHLQKVGCVSEMLANMKLLCLHMWPKEVDNIDELRLDITLRMLKSPHFNARMNSLKEVTVCLLTLNLADRTCFFSTLFRPPLSYCF